MIPVRFIVACEDGHVDDFPWVHWAHTKHGQPLSEADVCDNPQLRLNYTGKSGLMGLVVKCENEKCGARPRSLMGSAGPESLKGLQCSGNRPWLGPHGEEQCSKQPRMLQHGATNLYFPEVASSILIPPFSDPIRVVIDDPHNWSSLTSGVREDGSLDDTRLRIFAEINRIDLTRLRRAVTEKMTGVGMLTESESEKDFRLSEYRALLGPPGGSEDDFVTVTQNIDLYDTIVKKYFTNIVLVEKLAETRALTGFSRINPPQHHEVDRQGLSQLSLQRKHWLPAVRVYGEGMFLTLSKPEVDKWTTTGVVDRYKAISENHRLISQKLGREVRDLPPKFFVLHTLAHVLIRRLSFECGYGSSSLRERIYCWGAEHNDMTGILIYTAAGDSEGTMGGLVQQGKAGRFETLLVGAIEDAMWCSSDPLCIESHGQGIDSLSRAACYACALLPETSCEEGNRFLDRGALVGTPDDRTLGFFRELVQGIVSGSI